MKEIPDILESVARAVAHRDSELLENCLGCLTFDDLAAPVVVGAVTRGLQTARDRLANSGGPMVEFLLSVDLGNRVLEVLKQHSASLPKKERVVIGVVKGDVHDLGKNLVAGVMSVAGYDVVDLGHDVAPQAFMDALKKTRASILALSTMMSTPLKNMQNTIAICRETLPHVRILVGGAPLDADLAEQMGADAYAESVFYLSAALDKIDSLPVLCPDPIDVFTDYERKVKGYTLALEKKDTHG